MMKYKFITFVSLLLFLFSCTNNENDFIENETSTTFSSREVDDENSQLLANLSDSPESDIEWIDNQIIIKYKDNVSEEEKSALRGKYNVISYRPCRCSDNLSVWTLDPDIDVEPTVKIINGDDDDDEPSVDKAAPNFKFNIPMHNLETESTEDPEEDLINNPFNKMYLDRIRSVNNGVNIAVLDSGIDVDFPGFSNSFLYNSSNSDCGNKSGWDFVNDNPNPFDDHYNIHGTVVSYIIHSQLKNLNIPHGILPLKVSDSNGNVDFFDFICAFNMAIVEDVDVINLSLGWYGNHPYVDDLVSNLVDTTDAIIVTSAGNNGSDNDTRAHYPSGLTQDNVLAIAAANYTLSNTTLFSNYGSVSVDFFAPGSKIPFQLNQQNNYINLNGTSFAAPVVSGLSATLIYYGKQNVRGELSNLFGTQVQYNRQVFYNMLLQ